MKQVHQKERIDQFLSVLRANGYPELRLEACPDEQNRRTRDIDALAGPFAIEHTSLDGIPAQRGHDARFSRLVDGLRNELKQHFDFHTNVTFSYKDLLDLTAKSIPATRAALVDWLINVLPTLEDGQHRFPRTATLPFAILVRKWGTRRPGIFFMRDIPADRIEVDELRTQLHRKAEKLRLYKDEPECRTTVLLVDLNGSVFMNLCEFIELLYASFENASIEGVDQVWCVDALDSTCAEFWKLDENPVGPFIYDSEEGRVTPACSGRKPHTARFRR